MPFETMITENKENSSDFASEVRLLAAATKNASQQAVEETLALGLPITYLRNGILYHRFPDGREVRVSREEMIEVAGVALP